METPLDVTRISARAQELNLDGAKVHHLPEWGGYDDPKKLQIIRQIAEQRGRDPRIAKLAVSIIKKAKCEPREYKKQAEALLKWVQDPKNIYYVNEPGERLQDPIYTIREGYGDCDDQVLVLCALFESVRLPWKLVISGLTNDSKQKVRHIEGGEYHPNTNWSHIYCMVGTPAFNPKQWYFCESTVFGVPLGWDVVGGDRRFLPEMDKPPPGPAQLMKAPRALSGHKPPALPNPSKRSPAYALAYGNTASSVGSAIAEELESQWADEKKSSESPFDMRKIGLAILTGVVVSAGTQLLLDWVRGTGVHQGKVPGLARLLG